MRRGSKQFISSLLVSSMILSFSACRAPESNFSADSSTDPAKQTSKEEEPKGVENPLTGLLMDEQLAGKRPYAIMINNVKQALPQKGVSLADLIVEFPTEGSTNRMMAVFYEVKGIDEIGTVRSSRDYFVDYAEAMDAVYLHYGASPKAYEEMKKRKIDHLDGISGVVDKNLYWRDKARIERAGREHSVFTSGEKIETTIKALNVRTDSKKEGAFFSFGTANLQEALQANEIQVPFSHYISPRFIYQPETGIYLREEYGKPHIDAGNGDQQLAVKNVFVLFTKVTSVSGDTSGRLAVKTTGEGKGYYFVGGKQVPIAWSKKDNKSFPVFKDEKGKILSVEKGQSWICVVNEGTKLKIT